MQRLPFCFGCGEAIDYDPVYEAPCGHDDCASAVFHPLCLMRHRESVEELIREVRRRWLDEHAEHDPGRGGL